MAIILLSGAALVYASDGMTASPSVATNILGPDSVCKTVTNVNATGLSEYIPTATVSEWQDFYTKPPAGVTVIGCACNLPWGGTLASGASVTAYLAANANPCAPQTRTCATNGNLSGSYTNRTCAVSCTLPWGGSINSGASVTAYQYSSVTSPSTCPSQTRTCSSGTLSGTYTNSSCVVNPCSGKACVSDARLKRDVSTLSDSQGLESILKLRPVTFRWNDVGQDTALGPQIGFIAQEVQAIFPQVVSTSDSSMDIKLEDGTTRHVLNPKAVSYGYLAAPLVKAVQQLQAENDVLKQENLSLEKRIEKLEQLFRK